MKSPLLKNEHGGGRVQSRAGLVFYMKPATKDIAKTWQRSQPSKQMHATSRKNSMPWMRSLLYWQQALTTASPDQLWSECNIKNKDTYNSETLCWAIWLCFVQSGWWPHPSVLTFVHQSKCGPWYSQIHVEICAACYVSLPGMGVKPDCFLWCCVKSWPDFLKCKLFTWKLLRWVCLSFVVFI